jgi:hypothetical protein
MRRASKRGGKDRTDRRILPTGPLRGKLIIVTSAWTDAERLLPTYRGRRGDHEGIAFLLGVRPALDAMLITTAIAPAADHGPGHVVCNEQQMLAATLAGRELGITLLGQLHSHPSGWIEHSPGDDHLVFMPREGMVSIVAPNYGHTGLRPIATLGFHQFQDGRWVLIDSDSVAEEVTLLPASIDLR